MPQLDIGTTLVFSCATIFEQNDFVHFGPNLATKVTSDILTSSAHHQLIDKDGSLILGEIVLFFCRFWLGVTLIVG